MKNAIAVFGIPIICLVFAVPWAATNPQAERVAREHYSPYADRAFPERVYWGDTHVHTSRSPDAYTFGNRLDPDVAYRFAKGESVETSSGQRVRIAAPLDFLVVADHAEFTGVFPKLDQRDQELLKTALGRRWRSMYDHGQRYAVMQDFLDVLSGEKRLEEDPSFRMSVWEGVGASAERFNEPGNFTALIGYEWSSQWEGNNLHRVVVFRDGAEKTNQVLPISSIESRDPEDLWKRLKQYEDVTGGDVIAIPHNGNGSNGEMFANATFAGTPITQHYAKTRARWEPLYEVTQVKGDAEAHPKLSPDDEFADFFTWDWGNFHTRERTSKEDWMLQHEYARSALKLGLKLEGELGANPFKFGLIGSTDSHTSLANASEDNFFGKFTEEGPARERVTKITYEVKRNASFQEVGYGAAGYAAVWATENARGAIFDAMRRRETYATTGPRIAVRFFGGWAFNPTDVEQPDYARIGYAKGVPMGGDLTMAPKGGAPRFMIVAAKDPQGANLDRIQVVKGWMDGRGNLREDVYDVALSDGRTVDAATGKAPPLKHTVDVATASYRNSIGEAQLAVVWKDPEFDARERAFYYVRVLEIPTPRWSVYDAAHFGLPFPPDVTPIIQERAYTSPIWYSP